MTANLLDIRKELKERKPEFIRQDTHKRKKLSLKWRKPKGIHSKIRHHFKGRAKMPSPGYKSPAKTKGLHSSGLRIVRVFSVSEISEIKNENEGAVIAKSVGTRARLGILKKAKELRVKILNLNVDQEIKKIEQFLNSKKKKEQKTSKKEEVKEKESKAPEQAEKSAGKPQELSDEQKKEEAKKEKDKVLTKRT